MKIVVFFSGTGTNLESILNKQADYGYEVIGIFGIYMSFIGFLIYIPESFQNYIFPRFARSADTEIKQKNQKLVENAKAISDNLSKKEIVFIRQASDTGQLYGSVSPKDISNKLAEDKYDIQPSKINLSSAILILVVPLTSLATKATKFSTISITVL